MKEQRIKISDKLKELGKECNGSSISELSERHKPFHNIIETKYINFDFSKQKIDSKSFEWLLTIPEKLNLREKFSRLLDGNFENQTERREVSHTLYRSFSQIKGIEEIFIERQKIKDFFISLKLKKDIKNLICISIGGSRLGPEFLNQFQSKAGALNVFFCSSLDLLELKDALKKCNQAETIFLVSSKSFNTLEIIKNLDFSRKWFEKVSDLVYLDHLYAVSSNLKAMDDFGIKKENQFYILESLGGRYSVWSSMSIPAFVNSDYESYLSFLEGAYIADNHVLENEWRNNISMIMALLSIWNTTGLGINNHGIFTYDYRLRNLMPFLSQLSMESNGKSINSDSVHSPFSSTPLIWGGYGIGSQHSTFQWMMQGKTITSCDFIGLNDNSEESEDSYRTMLSQVLALTYGETNNLQPYKSVRGNNPCTVFQLHSLDVRTLGFLLALYEHKVFFEGLILGINSFDQWGVQLGKKLASNAKSNSDYLKSYFSSSILPN